MNEILTQNELQTIVGRKSLKRIIAWLERNRIPFLVSDDNRPLVNRQALAYLMGAPNSENQQDIKLNFDVEGFRR